VARRGTGQTFQLRKGSREARDAVAPFTLHYRAFIITVVLNVVRICRPTVQTRNVRKSIGITVLCVTLSETLVCEPEKRPRESPVAAIL
jgi:hypothetical protein